MTDQKEDRGGIMLGGISFGVGAQKSPKVASSGDHIGESEPASAPSVSDSGPVELSDVLLPLRVLVLGSFLPRGDHHGGANAPAAPLRVDGNDVDPLFARLAPRIVIEVASVLLEGGRTKVELTATSLKSFRPDELVEELPLLRSLRDGRRLLERLREGALSAEVTASELTRMWNHSPLVARVLGNVSSVSRGGPTPAVQAAPSHDTAVDRILDLMGGGSDDDDAAGGERDTSAFDGRSGAGSGGASGGGGGGKYGGFLSAVANSGKSGTSVRAEDAIRIVDEALSVQLGAILQHAEVRRIESAWRGLAFLARRTPKLGVALEVMSCDEAEIPAALERVARAARDAAMPVSFAVVHATLDGSARSLAWIRAVAEAAEASTVPVLTNVSPQLFGHASLDAIDRLDNKAGLFDAPERSPWRAEAHRPAMLWVSLAMNRIFARPAYDAKTSRVRDASVAELPAGDAATVWMDPAWAVASLALRSFGRHEWPCAIAGGRDDGMIEDLAVHELDVGGETLAIPTEVLLSTETQRSLGRIGILALASQPNSDAAYLMSAATAYVTPPKLTYETATAEPRPRLPQGSLVDQLFVARLAQYLGALASRIGNSEPDEDVREFMHAAVWEHFRNAPPAGPELTIRVADGEVHVTVRPRRYLGVTLEEVALSVPLG